MGNVSETLSSEQVGTINEYQAVVERCKALYLKKTQDYGTAWRVLRPVSIVDQVYIKAWRIRQIQEKKIQRVGDSIESEFIGIVNYGIIALIQISLAGEDETELSFEQAKFLYEKHA